MNLFICSYSFAKLLEFKIHTAPHSFLLFISGNEKACQLSGALAAGNGKWSLQILWSKCTVCLQIQDKAISEPCSHFFSPYYNWEGYGNVPPISNTSCYQKSRIINGVKTILRKNQESNMKEIMTNKAPLRRGDESRILSKSDQ